MVIPGYEIDLVAIERNAALALSEAIPHRFDLWQRVPILPQEVARRRVNRLDHVTGITQVHDAVVNKRRSLVGARLHVAGPDQLQILHITLIDLLEGTVAPGLVITAMNHPIRSLRR